MGKDFIKNHESGWGTGQGYPISAYIFILALEILFHPIRSKPEIKRLAIFDHCYFYPAYADDTTFFLQDTISIKHIVDAFYFFSYFPGLKPDLKEISNYGYWSPESGSSGSLWVTLYRSK